MFMPTVFHENLFDDLFDPFWNEGALERAMNREARDTFGKRGANMMKTDVKQTDNGYEVDVDLPGFKKEDIHVDVDGDTMTIRAERHSEHEDQDKKGNYVRCERSYGSYQRAFDISGVEVANISAQYNDGVLKLNMPKKSAVVNAKQIEIQ